VTLPEIDLVHAVVAMTPARILRLLSDAATTGEAPVVNVHLCGGQVLGGHLVSVGADHGNEAVVLADPKTGWLRYAPRAC
jgi:hypothetical protein